MCSTNIISGFFFGHMSRHLCHWNFWKTEFCRFWAEFWEKKLSFAKILCCKKRLSFFRLFIWVFGQKAEFFRSEFRKIGAEFSDFGQKKACRVQILFSLHRITRSLTLNTCVKRLVSSWWGRGRRVFPNFSTRLKFLGREMLPMRMSTATPTIRPPPSAELLLCWPCQIRV